MRYMLLAKNNLFPSESDRQHAIKTHLLCNLPKKKIFTYTPNHQLLGAMMGNYFLLQQKENILKFNDSWLICRNQNTIPCNHQLASLLLPGSVNIRLISKTSRHMPFGRHGEVIIREERRKGSGGDERLHNSQPLWLRICEQEGKTAGV